MGFTRPACYMHDVNVNIFGENFQGFARHNLGPRSAFTELAQTYAASQSTITIKFLSESASTWLAI